MQRSYPCRQWKKDVVLWDISTSVEPTRKGPLLISQLKGTAKTYMQEQMGDHSSLFQNGGVFLYPPPHGSLDLTGIQH
eukprot:11598080-Prorocentrum_lima.AAC.1